VLFSEETSRLLVRSAVAEHRRQLLGPAPSALERLLVDRIIATCLEVTFAARHVALQQKKSTPIALAEFHQHWLDRAQRRHLHALKTLAQVRRLLLPAVQINIAEQQVNQVDGGAELPEGVEPIPEDAVLGDLAIVQAENAHARPRDPATRRRDPRELAAVCAGGRPDRDHAVPLGDQLVDRDLGCRGRRPGSPRCGA
jgi:hypothetical protein